MTELLDGVQETDQIWLSRLCADDQKAFQELFEHYNVSLFYYACKFVDHMVARDVVQEAFIYIWQNRKQLMVTTSLNRYLFGVIRNMCLKHLRNQSDKGKMISTDELYLTSEELNFYQKDPEAINSLIEKELDGKLEEALAQLPPKCLQVFMLSRKEGLKNKEIAQQLAISEKAVEKHISKALHHLRRELKDYLPLLMLLGRFW
ncbi:MAG: RNA polymerase sigma-70 factor [Marinilabiliaceae bacterium]|nr:RNA polymerase sigma-70 factor [Marinilabiliaceae bacterium]